MLKIKNKSVSSSDDIQSTFNTDTVEEMNEEGVLITNGDKNE